ncbi:hypothetical protein BJ741DRAFT_588300 [Chytriomyces cf. hyalinus JEL632]|nr:hypothetical protein BJ741DRAFT_588300 [Chytriomyces cf. hyalinus JEL632]
MTSTVSPTTTTTTTFSLAAVATGSIVPAAANWTETALPCMNTLLVAGDDFTFPNCANAPIANGSVSAYSILAQIFDVSTSSMKSAFIGTHFNLAVFPADSSVPDWTFDYANTNETLPTTNTTIPAGNTTIPAGNTTTPADNSTTPIHDYSLTYRLTDIVDAASVPYSGDFNDGCIASLTFDENKSPVFGNASDIDCGATYSSARFGRYFGRSISGKTYFNGTNSFVVAISRARDTDRRQSSTVLFVYSGSAASTATPSTATATSSDATSMTTSIASSDAPSSSTTSVEPITSSVPVTTLSPAPSPSPSPIDAPSASVASPLPTVNYYAPINAASASSPPKPTNLYKSSGFKSMASVLVTVVGMAAWM